MNDIKGCSRNYTRIRKVKYMSDKIKLKESLLKLDVRQFKLFYTMFVHYWVKANAFISKQNFFNLWCELNLICSEADDSFPNPYDRDLIKSYCLEHPYYFIDIIDLNLVIELFCEHCDDRLDILIGVIEKLHTEGIWAAYDYSNEALDMSENIDELVAETKKWMKNCGGNN